MYRKQPTAYVGFSIIYDICGSLGTYTPWTRETIILISMLCHSIVPLMFCFLYSSLNYQKTKLEKKTSQKKKIRLGRKKRKKKGRKERWKEYRWRCLITASFCKVMRKNQSLHYDYVCPNIHLLKVILSCLKWPD